MRIKTNEIKTYVEKRIPFVASNVLATYVDGYYLIFSYTTLIAKIDYLDNLEYFDYKFYSVTTSKLQNIIKSIY